MKNIIVVALSSALLLSTINIYLFAWLDEHEQHIQIGRWVITLISGLPAIGFILYAMYLLAVNKDSAIAMGLVAAGLLLTGGSNQLVNLLQRKQGTIPN
ncbi:MAG: hypothetical protein QNJ78_03910 [Gammaproteobacteria bacterium]|nr:hypothetical protein [Gammaproteobacteria bacterium]